MSPSLASGSSDPRARIPSVAQRPTGDRLHFLILVELSTKKYRERFARHKAIVEGRVTAGNRTGMRAAKKLREFYSESSSMRNFIA